MPICRSVIYKIYGSPATLLLGESEQVESETRDDLMSPRNKSDKATVG